MISEAYHIDCNLFLDQEEFSYKFFNLIVADPPYFSGPDKRRYYGNRISKINIKRRDYDVIENWELPEANWFHKVQQAGEKLIIWGANYFDFIGPVHSTPRPKDLKKWIDEHPTGWIVWDKCNRNSSFNDYELAWTNMDFPTMVYRFMWNGMNQGKNIFEGHIMQGNKKLNQIRIHTTEKPIFLYKWLYFTFAKPGYKVLDTHLGSGSSRLAADEMEINFWGCEFDRTIFLKQEKRYDAYMQRKEVLEKQIKLFAR